MQRREFIKAIKTGKTLGVPLPPGCLPLRTRWSN